MLLSVMSSYYVENVKIGMRSLFVSTLSTINEESQVALPCATPTSCIIITDSEKEVYAYT